MQQWAIMDDAVVARILQRYGVEPQRLLGIQKGYRNESHPVELAAGQRLNLILYKSEPGIVARIRRANRVANFLAGQGFPARATADPRIVQLAAGTRRKYGALYHYLPGETIPWEAYTMEHLKLLGKTMGDMHAALAALPAGELPQVADECAQLIARMRHYFTDPQVQRALRGKLRLALNPALFAPYAALVKKTKQLPGQQPLHMDFVRGNILFAPPYRAGGGPMVTGILDFEKAAFGHRSFDTARTLAFLLVDCKYKPAPKVYKYFLHSGYNKRGGLPYRGAAVKNNRVGLLGHLVSLFLLHDFYKFLRHNPYEYLPQNEHFVRTVSRLHERGLLTDGVTSQ